MNRRTFIKGITGAAAAVAAGVGIKGKAEQGEVYANPDFKPLNIDDPDSFFRGPVKFPGMPDGALPVEIDYNCPLVGCADGTVRRAIPGEKPTGYAIARVTGVGSA